VFIDNFRNLVKRTTCVSGDTRNVQGNIISRHYNERPWELAIRQNAVPFYERVVW
jgi:hypothetical protein